MSDLSQSAPLITPCDATLGAVVTRIDLARMDDGAWRCVESAFHRYAVLIFPGQMLGQEDQIDFARRFGEIERMRYYNSIQAVLLSNVDREGKLIPEDGFLFKMLRGNEEWHTDSSYMPLAAKASVVSSVVAPSSGGETEWADMRAAYDVLDPAVKERISDLSAYHSLYWSQARIGHPVKIGMGYGLHTKGAPLRPLVKTHPVTGRKSLFLGRHAYRIPGLDDDEAQALLRDLVAFACRAPRTLAHRWRAGDVVIWDNRCVLHRARTCNVREPRALRHVRVAGDAASELAPTGVDEMASAW